jgi:hypothetical protein
MEKKKGRREEGREERREGERERVKEGGREGEREVRGGKKERGCVRGSNE